MRQRKPNLSECKEIFNQVRFRTKFEVALAEWNPKIDLIALASREGEVVVKRYLWKTGWKRNFSREQPFKQFEALVGCSESAASAAAKDQLNALCWSPNGQVLLVAFKGGRAYFLDAQTGSTIYSRLFDHIPLQISWLKYRPKCALVIPNQREHLLISTADFNFNENASKEHAAICGDVEQFYSSILNASLGGTFLCVVHADDGCDTFVDIFINGILPIQRICIEETLRAQMEQHVQKIVIKEMFFADGKFHVSIANGGGSKFGLLTTECGVAAALVQFPEQISINRLQTYNQIADCVCWMSFCCLYIREMFQYSVHNWQQSSEAFHKRVFAATIPNSASSQSRTSSPTDAVNYPLQMCKDLLAMLEEDSETTELVERFLSSPMTQKELSQANTFVGEFGVLINGISSALQPAAKSLRNAIETFRALLCKLSELQIDEDPNMDPAERLLDTLLKIARENNNKVFEPTESLHSDCERFITEFKRSVLLLEIELRTVLDLAERNRKELKQLLQWLAAMMYESGNDCAATTDENIDTKLLGQLLSEVVEQSGIGGEKCILDRVVAHLRAEEDNSNRMETDPVDGSAAAGAPLSSSQCPLLRFTDNSAECQALEDAERHNTTLWGHIHTCVQHFRRLYRDGITQFTHRIDEQTGCCRVMDGKSGGGEGNSREWQSDGGSGSEEQCEDEEGEEEAEEDRMSEGENRMPPRRSAQWAQKRAAPFSLQEFIFGYGSTRQ